MRLGVMFAALCGCNSVFGLHDTQQLPPSDAQYFDAPLDAPFACPALGSPPPAFSRILHQIPQNCRDYNTAAGWAVASCSEPAVQIAQGPPDGPFKPIGGLEQVYPIQIDEPRLTPEGDEMFVRRSDVSTSTAEFQSYQRGANDTWSLGYALTPPLGGFAEIGTPTRGPSRHMMTIGSGDGLAHELELAGNGSYTDVATYTLADLGIGGYYQAPNLSPDGLHMVFTAFDPGNVNAHVYYSDRASLADRFRAPVPLPGFLSVVDPFLTGDCARVYFSGLGSEFWVQQQPQ